MSNEEQLAFISDPGIQRAFWKWSKIHQKQRQLYGEKKMENQHNNFINPLNKANNNNEANDEDRNNVALNNALAQAQLQAGIQTHPILLAHDRNSPIRDYASPILYDFLPRIRRPAFQGSRFEMKPVILQMLQTLRQFRGTPGEDPHAHLKSFIEICNTFVILNITADEIHLTLFPFSLRDET